MSFSSDVKNELSRVISESRHCRLAEMQAIVNACGNIEYGEGATGVSIQTENVNLARKYFTLVKKTFDIDCEIVVRRNRQLNKRRVYLLSVQNAAQVEKILSAAGFMRKNELLEYPDVLITKSSCCKRAYIRGAFLGCGSLSDPVKAYHLEFVCSKVSDVEYLKQMFLGFKMDTKVVVRKNHYVIYLKEGEKVVDLLNIMGAYNSLMNMENIRIVKDMRNNVNRFVNCETANLNKVVEASLKQIEDIKFIEQKLGLKELPPHLREVALLRLEYPDASFKELGGLLIPAVGKSGVNHRLRKICEIAFKLRVYQ